MKEREITSLQARYLVRMLKRYDSEIEQKIIKHKWHMGEKMGYDVGEQVASIDYLKKHLPPWQEGYAVCFLEVVPNGRHFIQRDKSSSCDKCVEFTNLMSVQKKGLKDEFSLNQWFLGEKLFREVSERESETNFLKEYGDQWMQGFRDCYEERGCKHRGEYCKNYTKDFLKDLIPKVQIAVSKKKSQKTAA